LHVVLVEPEIPHNTGNIVRTCAATGTMLHLVGPLGFSMTDRYLKRAGLDYWDLAKVVRHQNFAELRAQYPDNTFYFTSKRGLINYTEVNYTAEDFLVFGSETKGLPQRLLEDNMDFVLKIPKRKEARSLNLSNAVAIILFEALRQLKFSAEIPLE